MEHHVCGDVLIVGAGLAGIYSALKLSPLKVSILTAAPLADGASSNWAQGGIAAALSEGDTPEDHANDTMVAGCHLNDPEIVKIITEEARDGVFDLFSYGVPFDQDHSGAFIQGREAAHSANRIVKVGGDGAGRQIMHHLTKSAIAADHITTHPYFVVFDLARDGDGRVCGVYARRLGSEEPVLFTANYVIFATGGIGHLYRDTTNPHQIRGEGLGIAVRHGADVRDVEFVQFHPTALHIGKDPAPLATEALRGEGGILVDEDGHRFMQNLHKDMELAPRDVVARGVAAQYQKGHMAFLDMRPVLGQKILSAFPAVSQYCLDAGIDPVTQPIPVKPAQHYHMGGIATDSYGQSSLTGLYVIGEAAGTGAHGANRLASNSLLEAIVFAARAANHIKENYQKSASHNVQKTTIKVDRLYAKKYLPTLRMIMSEQVGILRTEKGLRSAEEAINVLKNNSNHTAPFCNYADAALSIIRAAQMRKQAIGAHYLTEEQLD